MLKAGAAILGVLALVGCGTAGSTSLRDREAARRLEQAPLGGAERRPRSTVFDLFNNADDPNTTLEVNRYLWSASLEVLSFLPVAQADPFGGVIEFGFGVPPGGGQAYRATVLIQDPALDARSLNVAMSTRAGSVDRDTIRAVEDAILTRARQLRVRDGRL